MSQWIDDQAEESDHDEEDVPATKRARIASDDDDEDEDEDDETKIAEEMQGFVVQGDEDDEEEGEGNEEDKKSDSEDEEGDILEDDEELIEENLGISLKKRKRRVRVGSDSEEENDIEKQLFEGGDEEEGDEPRRGHVAAVNQANDYEEREEGSAESEGEAESVNSFISDDEVEGERPGDKRKKVKRHGHLAISDSALQEAREIFGDAIDLEDLYPEEEEEEVEEVEQDDYEEEDGEGGERPVERRTKKATATVKKRGQKKTLLDNLEPSELDRGYLSEFDKKIQLEDKPERFQLRGVPVTSVNEDELLAESTWIFKQLYDTRTVSYQDETSKNAKYVIKQIEQTLIFVRNQEFEVPFIAFYRKEYFEGEPKDPTSNTRLTLPDLWKVYQADEKWCQMRIRMHNLYNLFQRMLNFQFEFVMIDPTKTLTDDIRPLTKADMQRIWTVETPEALQDVYLHFLLYYGRDIPKMVEWERLKAAGELSNQEERTRILKQASRRDKYTICVDAKLCGLAKMFGLKPEQFGENLEKNYCVNKVEQYLVLPSEAAEQEEFKSDQFNTTEMKLKGAAYIVGVQLSREPTVRAIVRKQFRSFGVLCVRPTKKGLKEIDENHPLYPVRYLRNKPIHEIQNEEFLYYVQGESLGLIKVTLSLERVSHEKDRYLTYYEELIRKQLYHLDEYSDLAKQWNVLRNEALKICIETLSAYLVKETKARLIQEAKQYVLLHCAFTLQEWIKTAPYVPEQQQGGENEEDSTKCRVLGIAYTKQMDQASFCALIDGEGEVTDHLRLVHLTKRRNAFKPEDARLKEQDMETLRQFLINKHPHVIAIGSESLDALMIKEDISHLLADMEAAGQLAHHIGVEIVENDLAKVFMNCRKAQQDFPDYPFILRQAVSIARRLQDPLLEFCQMCNADEDILCLKYHPLQDMVSKEDLWNALQTEIINRVNEVGVDVNRCLEHPHTASVLQFVCGLGPRKSAYLMKILRQNDNLLDNRTKLVTVCHMGPKVFMNCAGFIKIDTVRMNEKTDAYVEVLDGTRIHPETYEWARKMAVDALEYDETNEDDEDIEKSAGNALDDILESPERLKDLDLDAFADELERQGFGKKNITLYDIRAELTHRYKDMRHPYTAPSNEVLFRMLARETESVLKPGKLVLGRVAGIIYRKPRTDEQDRIIEPKRNEETGLWQCTVCLRNDFAELSEVWSHVDMNKCPGQAVGVRVRLENGISGFIANKNLSDKMVTHPGERVKVGMPLYCRVIAIDPQRFSVNLSCASSILKDLENRFKPALDLCFDREAEKLDVKREKSSTEKKQKQQYVKRVIAHPSFQNCSYKDAENILELRDQGEVVIRPSSKGEDHLTVTWKVTDGIYQHIDVLELQKDNAFSLGRTLQIGDETFEDLDEIIARHVEPMASYAREIINYKYYHVVADSSKKRDEVERLLLEEKRKNPNRISYMFTASTELPGKFMLSYLPRNKARHEFVTVVPNGLRFRGLVHRNLNSLLAWFKEHFRDPIPGATPVTATPMDQSSSHRGFTPRIDNMSAYGPWTSVTRNYPPQQQPEPVGFAPPQQPQQFVQQPVYAAAVQQQPRRPQQAAAAAAGQYPNQPWTASY